MSISPSISSKSLKEKSASSIWKKCLLFIRDNIGELKYKTWFIPITPVSYSHPTLVIEVPSQFWYEWLEEHYFRLLRMAIRHSIGKNGFLEYKVVVNHKKEKEDELSMQLPQRSEDSFQLSQAYNVNRSSHSFESNGFPSLMNRDYTLDSFVEGDCNRIARTAAESIAKSPGNNAFNPLYVYGITGVGKTHLIQGISYAVKKYHKNHEVLYLTTERFISHYIRCVRSKKNVDYIAYYSRYSLLVVDDIQFLQGKKHTQQVFFHLFNFFHQNNKQIVISSDCMPQHIPDLNERLISRFNWGLSTQILCPDFETRRNIICIKSEKNGIKLDNEVLDYIAETFKSNVRHLEGAIIRLLAVITFERNNDISLDKARVILRDMEHTEKKPCITIKQIQKIASNYMGISVDMMTSKTRMKKAVIARQIAIVLVKKWTKSDLKTIGEKFGGRHHSTIIYAISTAHKLLKEDSKYEQMMRSIEQEIKLSG